MQTRRRDLPPMTSLPVFESVGRHMSIAKAADELCLTPGAVSRQIQNLESFLGCDLFERSHRRITFTPVGEVYWDKVHVSLGQIRAVTSDLSIGVDRRPLVIGSPRVFLQKCIMPVLGTLYARRPDIVVKFVTGGHDVEGVDGAIHVGEAISKKGFVCEILGDADLTPVCSPAYLRRAPPLDTPDDLERHTLLRSAEFTRNWERWLGQRAPRIFSSTRFIDLESSGLELTAAVEGLGIAIVRQKLVKQELADGQLVALFEKDMVHEHYFFMFADPKLRSDSFRFFRNWLRDAVVE
ncbi:LysR family glycine cleavage system transcriptional activator [Rhizobium sullae]|uniref:LysR family glycine cleavage system transcriptional activator n=2 Tax=Rhizobium sullae TaxID=50338 RepID=A0A4R3QKV2_RHISU|nr:LysR family glycine cleavage system transcriptional activator [Rhizobium sullae]